MRGAASSRPSCSTPKTGRGRRSSIRSSVPIRRPGARPSISTRGKIVSIEGLDDAESEALIEELTGYMVQPEGQYRHKWRTGDVVIWDNRCTYHKAAADYPPEEDRIHWRVSIKPN